MFAMVIPDAVWETNSRVWMVPSYQDTDAVSHGRWGTWRSSLGWADVIPSLGAGHFVPVVEVEPDGKGQHPGAVW